MQTRSLALPVSPQLFSDYLAGAGSARSFYKWDYLAPDWLEVLKARDQMPRHAGLEQILRMQNQRWDAPDAVLKNISLLGHKTTFAVVTGQQAGVFGGPMYTLYKTATTIKLAARLNAAHPEFNFVPVFWLEVQDSDFEEISYFRYLTRANELKEVRLRENPNDLNKPVGERLLQQELTSLRATIEDDFFETEFRESVMESYFDAYKQGVSYTTAFAGLIRGWFGEYGLVMIDPSDAALKPLSQALMSRAAVEASAINAALQEKSAELTRAGYSPQIQFRDGQTVLFHIDDEGRRIRLDYAAGDLLLKYDEGMRSVSSSALLGENGGSHSLSPNVALRPLLQDTLLPTVAYIGGPSEIAYFAQVRALYDYFDVPMPVIYPRHSVTIVEGKIRKSIEKLAVDVADILQQGRAYISEYLRKNSDQQLFDAIAGVDRSLQQMLARLKAPLSELDASLLPALEKTAQSIERSFQQLSGRVNRTQQEKHQVTVQQLEKILDNLYPAETFQERVLNPIYFQVKYGIDFADRLVAVLPDSVEKHIVIDL